MNNLQTATTRLRHTFTHATNHATPNSNSASDTDSDSDPITSASALDEQEQAHLIQQLADKNARLDLYFRLIFLLLPAISTLPYLVALLTPPHRYYANTGRLAAVLSITSLACTGWLTWTQPPGVTGLSFLDAWGGQGNKDDKKNGTSRAAPAPLLAEARRSPLERYLPYLNLGLCAVLVLSGYLFKSTASPGRWDEVWLVDNLPAIIYGLVLVMKKAIGNVDPERELGALRYEYKGA
ncbi:hypothetical protein GGR54DRAFT_14027 [Hypoxylon sp. NC1633]|nr:hypothetical protein GGR54DRAFT_14027 [Hypoxylon sp. NC1633]